LFEVKGAGGLLEGIARQGVVRGRRTTGREKSGWLHISGEA